MALVKCVAPLLNQELSHVLIKTADDKQTLAKSVLGRFPCLETPTGTTISGGLSIVRCLAREHETFYGSSVENSKFERLSNVLWIAARIDMWIDHVTALVLPATNKLLSILKNEQDPAWKEERLMGIATKEFREALEPLKVHLKLRNFLEGYNMTFADIWLAVVSSQILLNEKAMKDKKEGGIFDKKSAAAFEDLVRFSQIIFGLINVNPADFINSV